MLTRRSRAKEEVQWGLQKRPNNSRVHLGLNAITRAEKIERVFELSQRSADCNRGVRISALPLILFFALFLMQIDVRRRAVR